MSFWKGGAKKRRDAFLRKLLAAVVGNFFKDGGEEHYAPLLGEGPCE